MAPNNAMVQAATGSSNYPYYPVDPNTGFPTGGYSPKAQPIGGLYQTTSKSVTNLNRFFYASQALSGISQLASGFTGMRAASDEADMLTKQSQLAMQEAQELAAQKAREIGEFQSYQTALYAKSGVTIEGSPALVLEKTRREGLQEVNAILKRGNSESNLLRAKAFQMQRSGRSAFLSSALSAGADAATGYVYNKRANLSSRLNPYGAPTYGAPNYGAQTP